MRVAAWFSYNGEPFSGFARQNGQLTVQGNIEDALELLFRRRIDTTCAGRTDAGVHALCQVISFDLLPDEWFRRKPDSLLKSLNALTHEEISFRSVRPMPEDFSARFSAVMREYRYYICTDVAAPLLMEKFCWHLGKPLDVEAMKQASTHLLGEHDFKSFCMAVSAKDKPTHRYVADISFKQEQIWNSNFIVITVIGNAFLHSMVRTMVGTLVLVGRGKRTPEWVGEVLAARNRQAAGQNAPAEGLVLWHVTYDEQHFYYDPRPSGLRGELAPDQHLSDAIEDIPPVSTREDSAPKVVEEAPQASAEKGKKSSKKAKKRTGAVDSSPAARWARWRQEKEQDREIVIPRGPNLDACSSEEASAVSAFMTSDAQAVVVDSISAPGVTMPASSLEVSSAAETQTVAVDSTSSSGADQSSSFAESQAAPSASHAALERELPKVEPAKLVAEERVLADEPTGQRESSASAETSDLSEAAKFDFSQVYAGARASSERRARHAAAVSGTSEAAAQDPHPEGKHSKKQPEQNTEPLPSATVLSAAAARARRRARNL
ncbi:MAG: tRNA pseudouridine(38-40) synthase TruA [Eggerthella sp.]|nr:tRNA pseudouridine(38-40) synthase TruA [Eggerthella sp.]